MKINSSVAFIFARGGSKGVRHKNMRIAGGKSLLAHAIDCAFKSKYVSRVIVSTDCDRIASIATMCGAEALVRPPELATDASPEMLSWRHAIEQTADVFGEGKNAAFISLPATSPLRSPIDIDSAIERFSSGDCDAVFGICESDRNPYLNMVTIDDNGLIRLAAEGSAAVRRQDAPKMYNITTCVYVASPAHVQSCERLIDGRIGYVPIPPERALDIDTEHDLYLADLMLTKPFLPLNAAKVWET